MTPELPSKKRSRQLMETTETEVPGKRVRRMTQKAAALELETAAFACPQPLKKARAKTDRAIGGKSTSSPAEHAADELLGFSKEMPSESLKHNAQQDQKCHLGAKSDNLQGPNTPEKEEGLVRIQTHRTGHRRKPACPTRAPSE